MDKKFIAKALSIVLGPQIWLPTLLLVFIFRTNLTSEQISILLPPAFISLILVPVVYIYLALKFKWAREWDLPEKEERIPFFTVITISGLITLLLIYFFGNEFLFSLVCILFILMLINFFITYFWKISLHTGLNTAGSILVNFLFGWQFPLLFLSIPIIFWARMYLNKHTINQLLAGIAVNSIFLYFALYILGYML